MIEDDTNRNLGLILAEKLVQEYYPQIFTSKLHRSHFPWRDKICAVYLVP